MATQFVGMGVLGLMSLAGYSMWRDKKAGKDPICGVSCKNCCHCPHHLNGSCH